MLVQSFTKILYKTGPQSFLFSSFGIWDPLTMLLVLPVPVSLSLPITSLSKIGYFGLSSFLKTLGSARSHSTLCFCVMIIALPFFFFHSYNHCSKENIYYWNLWKNKRVLCSWSPINLAFLHLHILSSPKIVEILEVGLEDNLRSITLSHGPGSNLSLE